MALDNAEKRRSAAGVGFFIVGPGVTPNVSQDAEWRQQSAWGYSGIPAAAPSVRVVFERVVPPNPTQPIVSQNDNMLQPFQAWTQIMTRVAPITGIGSPEGIVEAQKNSFYMDDTGTAGNIFYIKRDADISGDKSQGWILV